MDTNTKHQSGGDAVEAQTGNASKQVDISTCRGCAKHVVSRPWFDSAVVGLILVNCIFLALDDPTAEVRLNNCTTTQPVVLEARHTFSSTDCCCTLWYIAAGN